MSQSSHTIQSPKDRLLLERAVSADLAGLSPRLSSEIEAARRTSAEPQGDSRPSAHRPSARQPTDRREDNNGANDSTCASSACESSATIPSPDPASSSSRVLFAKASELIRVELAACERRFAARLEKERVAREASHATLKSSLESIVCIVETISTAPQATSEPAAMNHIVAARIEDERRLRDEACASLLAKIETLSHQMQYLAPAGNLPGAAKIDEDFMNSLLAQERNQRSSAVSALQRDIARLNEEMSVLPTTLIEGAASWSKINVQLDRERSSRDMALLDLKKEMDALSLSVGQRNTNEVDEYLKVVMEQERRVNDLSRATMWKDFCREIEALSVEVQALKKAPQFDENRMRAMLENEKVEFQASCVKLQEDVECLAIAMQDVEASRERSRASSLQCSPMPVTAAPPSSGPSSTGPTPGSTRESPLQARLQSTAHLSFQSESTPPLPVLSEATMNVSPLPVAPGPTSNVAFQSVFGDGQRIE